MFPQRDVQEIDVFGLCRFVIWELFKEDEI